MRFRALLCDDDGATAVEYAILLGLILCALLTTLSRFGSNEDEAWGRLTATLGNQLDNNEP